MGWKKVKEYYRIEHIVCVEDDEICIGSPYVYDLIRIASDGRILKPYRDRPSVNADLARYMQEFEADPEKLGQLVQESDEFEKSIPVYTYNDGEIIEEQCEELGWPNVTHDGHLMYENTFSTDKNKVIKWAEKDLTIYIKNVEQQIDEASGRLKELQGRLANLKSKKTIFLQKYPHA